MLLSREQILGAADLASEIVDCPEWGGQVRVRALSAADRLEIARRVMGENGEPDDKRALDLSIIIPAWCIIDENGQRLFGEADVQALGEKSGVPLQRITEAVQRLSGMDTAATKKD